MYKSNLYRYNESSQEQDSDDQHMAPTFVKSTVFDKKIQPLIKSSGYNQKNNQEDNQLDQEESHLRPKLKIQPNQVKNQIKSAKFIDNVSGLMSVKNHSVSQANLNKKAVNAAYTFKLKSPNPTKKKTDPVSLFQQTSTSWKKDKFLNSRTDLKQGRKLQLQKRNKQNL